MFLGRKSLFCEFQRKTRWGFGRRWMLSGKYRNQVSTDDNKDWFIKVRTRVVWTTLFLSGPRKTVQPGWRYNESRWIRIQSLYQCWKRTEFSREGYADDTAPFDSLRNSVKGRAGNGIRFDSTETMFIADYKGHNILRYNMKWVSHPSCYIVKLSLVMRFSPYIATEMDGLRNGFELGFGKIGNEFRPGTKLQPLVPNVFFLR